MTEVQVVKIAEERTDWLTKHMGEAALEPSSLMIVLGDQEERRILETIVAPCRWMLAVI